MLKKYTLKEKRELILKGLISSIISTKVHHQKYLYHSINNAIENLKQQGAIYSDNFIELTKEIYGTPENDYGYEYLEFMMAKILIGYFLINYLLNSTNYWNTHVKQLMKNIKIKLIDLFPEYTFTFEKNDYPKYVPIAQKTIIDNISNTDTLISDPIKKLLMPFKSENEIIGLISKVHAKLEKINANKHLKKLNKTDVIIATKAKEIAKLIVNKVDSAKGHKGESELTIKDIAHNFALNASLFFKLVELNDEKSKQLLQDSPTTQKKD